MEQIASLHTGIHMAFFAAHGSLRIAAMGMEPGKPDRKQAEAMAAMAKEAKEAGALGISSGLMYAPGSFSEQEEMKLLCRAVAPLGGIYTSHIRNQGDRLLESVKETLEAASYAGISANISHHKAVGKRNCQLNDAGSDASAFLYEGRGREASGTLNGQQV